MRAAWCVPVLLATGGLRPALTCAQTAPAAPERQTIVRAGTQIRVIDLTGKKQSGRLVSLSDRELVFRQDLHEVRRPLSEIRLLEKVAHHILNGVLIGAATGIGVATAFCSGDGFFCHGDSGFVLGALLGSAGAAAGAGVGALIDTATDERRVVYRRQTPTGTTFAVTPGRASVMFQMSWR